MIVVIALGVLLLLGIGMAAVIFTIVKQQNGENAADRDPAADIATTTFEMDDSVRTRSGPAGNCVLPDPIGSGFKERAECAPRSGRCGTGVPTGGPEDERTLRPLVHPHAGRANNQGEEHGFGSAPY